MKQPLRSWVIVLFVIAVRMVLGQSCLAQEFTVVSGDSTPDAIPDSFAYRMVLNSLAVQDSSDKAATYKQTLRFQKMGLSQNDRTTFAVLLTKTFLPKFTSWQQTVKATKAHQILLSSPTDSDRDAIVTETLTFLQQQLSTSGYNSFTSYVKRATTNMKFLKYD